MSNSIADALALALLARREENYARIAHAAQERTVKGLLPRGTNAKKLTSTSVSEQPKKCLKLVPNENYNPNGHPAAYKRHQRRLENMMAPQLHHDLIVASRRSQALSVQAEHVEQHMNLTKPVKHRYAEPIHAHDRALDWERPDPEIEHRRRVRDRANAAIRRALQEAADNGEL